MESNGDDESVVSKDVTKVIAISKTLAGCDDQERHIKSCGDAA
jgi:hypothetical protein